jgi:hypothetical protein
MCGIFGIISRGNVRQAHLQRLADHARQRGRDSSGLMIYGKGKYQIERADYDIKRLLKRQGQLASCFIMGHSRLITNGLFDNQPVVRNGIVVIHNGIIINDKTVWKKIPVKRKFQIDSEVINGLLLHYLAKGKALHDLPNLILNKCKGTISSAVAIPELGKILLFSNNGSLYVGKKDEDVYFCSEQFPLRQINCSEITQILHNSLILDIPTSVIIDEKDDACRRENLIPILKGKSHEEKLLIYPKYKLRRCTKCILPETMPFIEFDAAGICNYCHHYQLRNRPKPKDEIFHLVEPYRRKTGADCILPFSGGRDSCYGLHLVVKELKMKPITYTYDWGMVTDLGRRNISRMCAQLGVENIIVAADISKKRQNIALNFKAWLKAPHLGMVSILTAGDKHFFRHVETVKRQTGIRLNLWGINPLEVTYFKAGFLGVPPDFEEKRVYMQGVSKQIFYQWLRLKSMARSLGYFNSSLWDTLSGEYFRSFTTKQDYFHIYDYWAWDEKTCNDTLKIYDWELAPDTTTTWRIGDGTAAIYNYINYTMAGFTEHDTFRSNQIREGSLTRQMALNLVKKENRPRYQNIRWYLDSIGVDFKGSISIINNLKLKKKI